MDRFSHHERLLRIAELEHIWDSEYKIIEQLVTDGYYLENGNMRKDGRVMHDRSKMLSIQKQVDFLKKIKQVFKTNENSITTNSDPVCRHT